MCKQRNGVRESLSVFEVLLSMLTCVCVCVSVYPCCVCVAGCVLTLDEQRRLVFRSPQAIEAGKRLFATGVSVCLSRASCCLFLD